MTDQKNIPSDDEQPRSEQVLPEQSDAEQPDSAQSDSAQPEQEQPVAQNRAARRGHAQANGGVNKVPGRPHQASFVGRRVFRRTGG